MLEHYNYAVHFIIDVKRTDNEMLTDSENEMVEKMRNATKDAIAKIMAEHGNGNQKTLIDTKTIY